MVNKSDQKYNQWSQVTGFRRSQVKQYQVAQTQTAIGSVNNKRTQRNLTDRPSNVGIKALRSLSLLAGICLLSVSALGADFSQCAHNFYAGTAPDYVDTKLLTKSVPLCFNGFATMYSGLSRTPLWSAEHLTRDRLLQAEEIPREDSFHSESRVPESMRAELSDYKGSGYDRGHLAPNGDMANKQQQYDSFSLANIVPQDPRNNRYSWRNIESVTRYLTKQYGEAYVVTGVAFKGRKVTQLNGRVLVPSHVFKAVYVPQTGEAGVYYAPNDDSDRVEVISVDELALRSGIDAFPGISPEAKAGTMVLATSIDEMPEVTRHYPSGKSHPDSNNTTQSNGQDDEPLWYLILIEILRWFVNNFLSK
ncbi:DNA/RNA non-specific endonuclease [Psychrobacter sp. FDAARGOS_221]|uniref:DNA/RNA non-specific endonuclease n=1 Tax=Psychrobacter sp. FDAARGOS_221 TaxID=1975705 RepID=UPI000BB52FB6|nr:DNA/RNA non-specific endonuclease [Psychrobacter sp. FDAARGOS_221]PNK60663.1 DNA/RNA non-specific endonuclease [Psychrobacter sp. FDAARGOS_221]